MEDLAAALIAERAGRETRTGARSLRPIFSDIINPFEFDPEGQRVLSEDRTLIVTADMVREKFNRGNA